MEAMSLTGWPVLVVVVVLTVAAFVGLIVRWPSVASGRPVDVLARVGMLVAVNALVLLTAAVVLNDQYLFFADWADLKGAISGSTTRTGLQRGGGAVHAAAARVPGQATGITRPALQPLPPGQDVGNGGTSYMIRGPASGITANIVVTLPPGYSATAAPAGGYPVVETFGGYPSQPTQWIKTMALPTVMAAEVAQHHLRSALIVSPQVQIPAGVDTECVNGEPGNPQVETWLSQDVPQWVMTHFRVQTDRSGWASIGLSAGGWCAAMVTMLHPTQYSAAIVLGGYFRPDFGSTYEPYPASSALASRYDLVALARQSRPAMAMWVETSHADPLSYTTTSSLLKVARPPLSVSAVVLQNVGHRIGVWQQLLPGALTWLGANIPGFRVLG